MKIISMLLGLAIALGVAPAVAQTYPERPLTLVVPYPAGGSTDILGRLIAERLGAALSQTVIVENRSGAGGNIGADAVARAQADGYTVLIGGAQNTINATLYKNLPFNLQRDLTPVAMIGVTPNVMVVPSGLPVNTPQEFIAYAKERPGKLNYASSGNGASTHMAAELFKVATGVQMAHIPYRGSGPALIDLIAGQTQVMFDNISSALPQVQAGKLRALALTGGERSTALPDVPTLKELGIPVVANTWFALFAPAGTPPDIVNRLNHEMAELVMHEDFKAKLAEFGASPQNMNPAELVEYVDAEVIKWREVIEVSGATID